MINRKVLKEILQPPVGPYHDKDVLDKTCQLSRHCYLALYSFILEHNGQVIGYALDESERDQPGADHRKFRFRGVLKIANPDWLSDRGKKLVEAELDLRWYERSMREGERRGPQLTLEGLFTNDLLKRKNSAVRHDDDDDDDACELLIQIQGERGMSAVFMLSRAIPTGLLWNSKDSQRQYEILTMDVATYSRSENFFWRYRLLALMEKIAEKYPYVPLERRDPEWFVTKYMRGFAYPKEDLHHRIIYDSDDPDLDEENNSRTPRQLLHVHRSDILGLFAAHAEWFITDHAPRRSKVIDIKTWDEFYRRVKKERREAAKNGVTWGWPVGQERTADDLTPSASSDSEEEAADIVKRNPVIGKPGEIVRRKLMKERARKLRARPTVESSSSESASDKEGHAYASDFSEKSDSTWELDDLGAADQNILDAVPWQLQVAPDPPDADGRWRCPLPDCQYKIDLGDLTEENKRNVDGLALRYIVRKRWRSIYEDDMALDGWLQMVRNHYNEHFEEVGVRFTHERSQERVEWMKPRLDNRSGHIRGNLPAKGSLRGESALTVLHVTEDVE
ncbi:hypothetical protein ID866_6725 [Astraeus odoratus]|nr:hypothetical protein ID866_6725 [Astraeus odoratus]